VTACIDYQRSIVSTDNLNWLRSLPLEIGQYGLRLVHGGWSDPIDEYLQPRLGYFQVLEGKFFASGHSHIPLIFKDGEKAWCNPGSVGQPRDGNPKASFATFNGLEFLLHRVEYDIDFIVNESIANGLPEKLYGGLAIGSKNLLTIEDAKKMDSAHD
jgi:diadenosine tetraphosphatase ApaH/serine/threonine PP2A family protein phosphatase